MKKGLLLVLVAFAMHSCVSDQDICGPFDYQETPFSQRDTFDYQWLPTEVSIGGVYNMPKIVRWDHQDSVRIESHAHGVTHNQWKISIKGDRYDDSSFYFHVREFTGNQSGPGSSIECEPLSYIIERDVIVYAPHDKIIDIW